MGEWGVGERCREMLKAHQLNKTSGNEVLEAEDDEVLEAEEEEEVQLPV